MDIVKLEKEYEEEIVLEGFTASRVRNIVGGVLNREERKGGPKVIKENSDLLFKMAKALTERDINRLITGQISEKEEKNGQAKSNPAARTTWAVRSGPCA